MQFGVGSGVWRREGDGRIEERTYRNYVTALFGSVRFDSCRLGSVRFGSVRFDSVRLDTVRSASCPAAAAAAFLTVSVSTPQPIQIAEITESPLSAPLICRLKLTKTMMSA